MQGEGRKERWSEGLRRGGWGGGAKGELEKEKRERETSREIMKWWREGEILVQKERGEQRRGKRAPGEGLKGCGKQRRCLGI